MGFLVPKAYCLEVLQEIIADAMTLRIYGNDKTPAPGDSTAAYTEIAGGGYASKPLTTGNWIVDTTTNVFPRASYNNTQIWTFTGPINAPGTIYGWFVTRDSDNKLLMAERFPTAIVPFIPIAGSQARILPRYSVASQF